MLYLLLSIIAVGVLLCSEPGKRILSGATGLLLIGILVILGVLVVTNFATFIDCALTIIGIPIVFLGIRWIVIQIEKRITWYRPGYGDVPLVLFILSIVLILIYLRFKSLI